MTAADPEDWVGRRETASDMVSARQARLMAATLGRAAPGEGEALPPLWHWMLFPEDVPTGGLGPDGHPPRGAFLPPVPLPRRMWAGGRLRFAKGLQIGGAVERRSEVLSVTPREGRSGRLCFVTVRHRLLQDGAEALTEEHDIVYRGEGAGGPAPEPPGGATVTREVVPSMPLLFRYSALTFNAHRIHYDQAWCRAEGYPGVVVHGPLVATLLAGLAAETLARPLERFDFRATAPLFHDRPVALRARPEGRGLLLWAETPEGGLAMRAEAG